ncbi:hypothetical protein MKJ04_13410 [Pontibacter sp. E15-1]|nr:hypothetical protein [Pontibacter sp. E15-1]MCJ8165844.1 hypothetical protein [Pontibacter sp. E15-1]
MSNRNAVWDCTTYGLNGTGAAQMNGYGMEGKQLFTVTGTRENVQQLLRQ